MIQQLSVYQGRSLDPYYNLAVEKLLLEKVAPGQCILYLWQNQNTVVIGCNQNPWLECRTTLLEQEGGLLARRLSGGGAVFHDIGNLNFTFLVRDEDYDVDRQLSVIQQACLLLGIRAEKSGRNDVLAEGKKFSGNAFYHRGGQAYHHGTLLIDVDMTKLQRYLSPPKAKLESKGIASVRSRVVNLRELAPELTCDKMRAYMVQAFEAVYGLPSSPMVLTTHELEAVEQARTRNASWDFLYGKPLPFTFQCEARFPWGGVQLQLEAKGGVILCAKVYSDAMDWSLAPAIEAALTGCEFRLEAMQDALLCAVTPNEAAEDLCRMLAQQDI